jgi:hypothetical protein
LAVTFAGTENDYGSPSRWWRSAHATRQAAQTLRIATIAANPHWDLSGTIVALVVVEHLVRTPAGKIAG